MLFKFIEEDKGNLLIMIDPGVKPGIKSLLEKLGIGVKDGMIIGLGTGSTARYAILRLGEMVREGIEIIAILLFKNLPKKTTKSDDYKIDMSVTRVSPLKNSILSSVTPIKLINEFSTMARILFYSFKRYVFS